jgi:hypothetical protein
MRSLAPLLLSLSLLGCAPVTSEQHRYQLRVRVDSDPGVGLAGVSLNYGSMKVGVTGADGTAQVMLEGREGQRAPVEAMCPETHSAPSTPSVVVLRTYLNGHVPELLIRCPPRTRKLAVVVRAKNGEELDLLHRGKTIGRTDSDGVAHLLLEGPPGDAFEVVLDTSDRPRLHPQNPGGRFMIAARDDVLLFDPELTIEAPPPAPRKRKARRIQSNLPQRIR